MAAAAVAARLTDAAALRKARVHPMAVLLAHKTYSAGRGEKGKLTWTPAPEVVAALDQAFELAFASVQPAGKRFMLVLDVSGSMCASINGSGGWGTQPGELSCHEASAAMAESNRKIAHTSHASHTHLTSHATRHQLDHNIKVSLDKINRGGT